MAELELGSFTDSPITKNVEESTRTRFTRQSENEGDSISITRVVRDMESANGEQWYFPIQLTEAGSLLPPLHSLPDNIIPADLPASSYIENRVTGMTTSRLDEVRTYSDETPFIVGAFGVVAINDEFISYVISGITYTTNRTTLETTYVFGTLTAKEIERIPFLYRSNHEHGIEIKPTKNNLSFSRSPMAVLETIYRLGAVNSLDDIEDLFAR